VDVPNSCATLWLPTDIFDFDIKPNAVFNEIHAHMNPTSHFDGTTEGNFTIPLA
jgi:hypothetical protein